MRGPSGAGRRIAASVLMAVMAATPLASCNRAGCDGTAYDAENVDPKAPVITNMQLLRQVPDSPWTLIFTLNFTDADGDLGAGEANFYIGKNKPLRQDMQKIFPPSEVPLDATSGRLGLTLTFTESGVQDDTTARLETQLTDGANRVSNCFFMDINFALQKVTALLKYPFEGHT
jgi:hypothetical protein